MYLVEDFYKNYEQELGLRIIAGQLGLNRVIRKPEAQRPGLSLSGYIPHFVKNRVMVIGRTEMGYLRDMEKDLRKMRLKNILSNQTPAVIIGKGHRPVRELTAICKDMEIPLFLSHTSATELMAKLTFVLEEKFSPSVMMHGTLVEVFGIGVLIQGESSIGKSEAALGLIERGHRLISDDVVKVYKKESAYLVGYGPDLTRHLMEIRGIGIINVAHLYGAVCVRPDKALDIVVKLEKWDDCHFYDRVGLEEKFCDILGISIPFNVLPVKPGRDVMLLIETIALNHRLKHMGYHSAKEFNAKLLQAISKRQPRASIHEMRQES